MLDLSNENRINLKREKNTNKGSQVTCKNQRGSRPETYYRRTRSVVWSWELKFIAAYERPEFIKIERKAEMFLEAPIHISHKNKSVHTQGHLQSRPHVPTGPMPKSK